ncbi:cytochrome P450 4c3 isoform X1 [Lasioglossum baleicum]|uniref:cytochrome P450 4c3 isoform X1 n=1 Tax=Lasioglossum baleicum TaxID=434251 RepID=UPI003FCE0C7B
MPSASFAMGASWVTLTLSMCLLTIILLLVVRRGKFLYALRKVPSPPAFPIIGNAYQLCCSPEQAFKKMNSWGKELGDMYLIWVGMRPFIFLYKAEAVQPLLSSSVHIDKSLEYQYLRPWLGTGLVTSTGEKWHSRRKLLTPTFHSGLLEVYLKTATKETGILISCLRKEVSKSSFDIFPYAKRATLDIICDGSMGCHINAQTDLKNEYVQAVDTLASISQRRFLNVWMSFDPIFKLTTWGKKHDHALRIAHDFVNEVIAKRKDQWKAKGDRNFDEGFTKYQTLLDLLLDLSQDGEVLTDEDIRNEVHTFMFAGHDTTATSVSWILYALGRHPEYQEKILHEYYNVAGTDELSFDILNKLTWLTACIKESWRVYPVAPLIGRQIYNPITISGHNIPIGSTVLVNLFLLHRDPRHFPEPDSYRPERFLPNGPKYPPFAFIPFSAGSRNCIGWKYATMIVKVVILFVLRNFHVKSLDTEDQLRFTSELVLHNADGLRLKITPRDPKIFT